MKLSQKRKTVTIVGMIFATVISVIHIIPIIVVAINSIRGNSQIEKQLIGIPDALDFTNYAVAWERGNYLQAYTNSLIIGISTSIIVLTIVALAVYGLTKLPCYFSRFFHNYFVAGLAIPSFAVIVPLFFAFTQMKIANTLLCMIIIYSATNISFNFIFVYAFFQGMPKEFDEAARIDGATELQNFIYNIVPLAKPIFTSVLLIVFVNTWNEFLFSNTFLQSDTVRTVSLKFYTFVGKMGADYGYIYAAAIISILPIVLIFLIMQNSFVDGMTAGSVKG